MNFHFNAVAISATLMFCGIVSTSAAFAADRVDACSTGNVSIVRISKLTPTGSMAGFSKAVADHAKWYADHGYADQIVAAPVLAYDKASDSLAQVQDQIMTFHNHSVSVPKDKHDAAWDSYVAEYRANSTIATETLVCMPK